MKRIILVFVVITNILVVNADIIDICQTIIEDHGVVGYWGQRIVKYDFSSDTVINGHNYSKHLPLGCITTCFVREEGSKVLVWNSHDSIDLVLYDYSLGAGDSLASIYEYTENYDSGYYTYYKPYNTIEYGDSVRTFYKIKSVSTWQGLDGKERKLQKTELGFNYSPWMDCYGLIAEGLGDIRHGFFFPLQAAFIPTEAITHFLLCASVNDACIYVADDWIYEQNGIDHSACLCCNLTDGIENTTTPTAKNLDLSAPMYNVLGQPVDKDYRGIVIQNGRKYVR